jgi:hypothetical protein
MRLPALLFFFAFASRVLAQGSANAVFDRNAVETGDTFVLRVMVAGVNAQPGKVDFSPWGALLPAGNILSRVDWARNGGRWVSQYTFIAFDSAGLELPPLKVPVRAGETLETNTLQLTVKPTYATPEVDTAERIRDIRRESGHWSDYWPWALGALTLLLLLSRLLRRKKKPQAAPPPVQAPPPVAIPAHQIALQKLTLLEQKQQWKKGELLPFYAEISLVMREYLENRFRVPALESTTREILPLLKNAGFPDNLVGVLRDILHESDMTKYAQHPPPEHFHEKALQMARQLIMATAPPS